MGFIIVPYFDRHEIHKAINRSLAKKPLSKTVMWLKTLENTRWAELVKFLSNIKIITINAACKYDYVHQFIASLQ